MAASSQPQRQWDNRPLSAADLARALDAVLFERTGARFLLITQPPEWFLNLTPAPDSTLDLLDRFPLLEVFLPDAERCWSAHDSHVAISDIWTETVADNFELHLQAKALRIGSQHLLLITRAEDAHRTQQQLQQYAHEIELLNRQVEQATRAKSAFLANMSHEIRTPMNAILGMAELLANTELTPDQQRYVDTFQRAGSNLLGIINDILDLSKVESGRITLEWIAFDLREVVERALELIRVKANEKGLEVKAEIAPDVPPVLAGDSTRLRQIILNLLGNSLKFTEKGGLTVRIAVEHRVAESIGLRFAIADTGIGIPPEKLETIFESFTQADASTTRHYGGTGLGLSISKKLVELMGGRIWVESIVGEGSTFLFIAEFGIAQEPPKRLTKLPQKSLQACHVLLADDSEDNRFLIRSYLKDTPVSLEFAENGEIALQKLTLGDYDLVLMDVHMPVLDGFETTRRFRDYERGLNRAPIAVLALTADAFQEAIDKSVAAGFTAHLSKPIRRATLLEAIAKYARTGTKRDEIVVEIDPAIADIVPMFLDNMRRNSAAILAAAAEGDLQTPRTLGHNMKGTGTAYGFAAITQIGAAIEQAAKDANWDTIRTKAAELTSYLDGVRVEYAQEKTQ